SYGIYRFGLSLGSMGHNFAFGAKSLYDGIGTANLTLPDDLQTDLSGSASTTDAANRLRAYADSAGSTDLALRRDQIAMDLAWDVKDPIKVNLDWSNEKRKGTRPFGATFGFGNAIEVPEPIDYDTTNLNSAVEYKGKSFYASVTHAFSAFNNANSTLLFDNPFRIADSIHTRGYSQNYLNGAIAGRFALAPDNSFNNLAALVTKELPAHSRLVTNASLGWMRQNENLPPITTNSALATAVGYEPTLPRNSAEAAVNTKLYSLALTSKPIKKLHAKAHYRYQQHQNKTEEMTIPIWVSVDVTSKTNASARYVSSIKRSGGLELAYDVAEKTEISLALENENASFNNGSANSENENVYKLGLNTKKIRLVDLRFSLERANKKSDYPDYTLANLELPWMRKYYAAGRDRNRVVAMVGAEPLENVGVEFEYIYGQDKFPKSEFGLQKDVHHIVSMDVDWALTEQVRVTPFYTLETYKNQQRNRAWSPTGTAIGSPYNPAYSAIEDNSNWTLITRDVVHTPGIGVEANIIKDRLDVNANVSYSDVNGALDFSSPVGTSANDGNAFEPQDIDNAGDSTLISFNSKFDYKVKENLKLAFGYNYQRWKFQDDLLYDGYDKVYTSATGAYNGLLSMDTMYKPYQAHTVYMQAAYTF
ncbi:MAG: MtrB/PioB family outer membrane beta-barrel protein, partial [Elusimicrobiota bacterium]